MGPFMGASGNLEAEGWREDSTCPWGFLERIRVGLTHVQLDVCPSG